MKSAALLQTAFTWLVAFAGLASGAGVEIFRHGDEVIVQLPELDRWRQQHARLPAIVRLTGEGGDKSYSLNLADRWHAGAIVIDIAGYGRCAGVSFVVQNGQGQVVVKATAEPVLVPLSQGPPLTGDFAAIEPGSKLPADVAPKIPLPDASRYRVLSLAGPARTVKGSEITYPVIADADLPGSGSTNAVVVSRQSRTPHDSHQCSLYFSYRKPLYDPATLQLREWRKLLVEVPLEKSWAEGSGDELVTLPLDRFAIHTTDERERAGQRWNAPEGYNMLGGSPSGLFQGGQTVDTDEEGRIYITNVPDGAGIVRFNPYTGLFEQPPVNLFAEARQLIPAAAGWTRSWDTDLAQAVCTRGRIFLVFDRNYRVNTPNGKFETCSGVISAPLAHWDDAAAFKRELRLHAACWPEAKHPLYDNELAVGGSRRLGPPLATTRGIAFGEFRLDLDSQGNTERLAKIQNIADPTDTKGRPLPPAVVETYKGLRKQRLINVGAAGRAFVQHSYGEFTISRAALALTLPDALAEQLADAQGRHQSTYPGAPAGNLTVRFDIMRKIKSDPQRYGALAASLAGVSQGPAYAVIAVPGEADQAIAICDYNYFLSRLDFSRRHTDRKVYKSYLTQASMGQQTGFPLAAGLGPYNSAWMETDGERWLYLAGYTGLSRMKYGTAERPLESFTVDVFHHRLQPEPIDGQRRDSVKDFLHVIPALDGKLINIGRGRPGRGGGARSAGLELFGPRDLNDPAAKVTSQTAVEMNRCYGLYTPISRLVHSTREVAPRQEIMVASGNIRPEYLQDIADPAQRPQNQDPKLFAYECDAGSLRDRFGLSLPLLPGGRDSSGNLAISPCSQYAVVMQNGGALLTYSLAQRRFVDSARLQLASGKAVQPLEFSRPSATIWNAPNGRIFFHSAADGDQSTSVDFYEVQVSRAGQLTVAPHLSVMLEKGQARELNDIVHAFLPDLSRHDGSYDLILGSRTDNGGQPNVRVIDDFVPARK